MKYYNSNNVQVVVHSTKDPEKVYFFPPKATLIVKEELKNLPSGVRKLSDQNKNKK